MGQLSFFFARISILFGVAAGFAVAAGPAAAIVPGSCLPPPDLDKPATYIGKCPEDPGGPVAVNARGKDVLIELPADQACARRLSVTNARNIRIVGGRFLFNDNQASVISIGQSSGITFIEGLHIDVQGRFADAIRFYRHTGSAIIQNTRIEGVGGTPAGPHGDVVHAQGGGPLSELTLQNVSGYSGYQGLFTPFRDGEGHGTHKLRLDRVNFAYDPRMTVSKPLILLYIGDINHAVDMPPDLGTTLDNVYVNDFAPNFPFDRSIKARPIKDGAGCASFAAEHKIAGTVCGGLPPDGDFAPDGMFGENYKRDDFCSDAPPREEPEAGKPWWWQLFRARTR